ncbi:MAG: flagellar basal body rod protein FlgC [Candidatus Binatia bacterium]
MGMFDVFALSGAGMAAQRSRMNVVAGNLANAETTRTPEGGPYRRHNVLFRAEPTRDEFSAMLTSHLAPPQADAKPGWFRIAAEDQSEKLMTVRVDEIRETSRAPKKVYDPHHPDTDAEGYVSYPDINPMEEMADLMSAVRSYEANLATFNATKTMIRRLLDLARSS